MDLIKILIQFFADISKEVITAVCVTYILSKTKKKNHSSANQVESDSSSDK